MPRPAPASFVATRTASPTGSGPRGAAFTGGRGRAVSAPDAEPDFVDRADAEPDLVDRADAEPDPLLRAAVAPAFEPRAVALAFFAVDLVAFDLVPPLPPAALPEPAAPPARLSLLRPGRERGRLPMTPGSSVTAEEYCGRLTIPCASCTEIRCFARERRDEGVYSWPRRESRSVASSTRAFEGISTR
ncbi:MAG: hypothetical protein QOJ14_1543 [Thermoleophilaceae bacterium]|nr:hypothetical protein [Thermoleophilaceae bacterium]